MLGDSLHVGAHGLDLRDVEVRGVTAAAAAGPAAGFAAGPAPGSARRPPGIGKLGPHSGSCGGDQATVLPGVEAFP